MRNCAKESVYWLPCAIEQVNKKYNISNFDSQQREECKPEESRVHKVVALCSGVMSEKVKESVLVSCIISPLEHQDFHVS